MCCVQRDEGDQTRTLEAEASVPRAMARQLAENDVLMPTAAMPTIAPCRAAGALPESAQAPS